MNVTALHSSLRISFVSWLRSALALLCILSLSACITAYRMDVRQGNHVTQEMVAQLKSGMTEEQVRFIMGTPLLIDPFHPERWDYVYQFAPGGKVEPARRVTLVFAGGKLQRVEGDVIAAIQPTAPGGARP